MKSDKTIERESRRSDLIDSFKLKPNPKKDRAYRRKNLSQIAARIRQSLAK